MCTVPTNTATNKEINKLGFVFADYVILISSDTYMKYKNESWHPWDFISQ